jgi:hypothetical protein
MNKIEKPRIDEDHSQEQYFFDRSTVLRLTGFIRSFQNPCCLCAPTVGEEFGKQGIPCRVLDADERFSRVPGFLKWDLYRPTPRPEEKYGIILCDPPFWKVKLSQLFRAVRILSGYDYRQPLLFCYLQRRSDALLSCFAQFGLSPTGCRVSYLTIPEGEKTEVRLYSNLEPARLTGLAEEIHA